MGKQEKPRSNNPKFINKLFIENTFSDKGAPIRQSFKEDVRNVVYAIQCTICKKIYIGETGNSLKTRIYQHTYQLNKTENSTILYNHLRNHGPNNYIFLGLENNNNWSRSFRKRKEREWINTLETINPKGLNEKQ